MIKDTLAHAARYYAVHPRFQKAFEWLQTVSFEDLSDGRIEIDGEFIVALPQHYETHPFCCRRFETHQRYIDIQFIATGTERIVVGNPEPMEHAIPYDEAKDIAFWEGRGADEQVRAGEFLIIWPDEAHAPGCDPASEPVAVHKIIIKVAVE